MQLRYPGTGGVGLMTIAALLMNADGLQTKYKKTGVAEHRNHANNRNRFCRLSVMEHFTPAGREFPPGTCRLFHPPRRMRCGDACGAM